MTAAKTRIIAEAVNGTVYIALRLKNNGVGEFDVWLLDSNEEFETCIYHSNGNQSVHQGLLDAKDALITSAIELVAERNYDAANVCNEAADVFVMVFANTVYRDAGNYPSSLAWLDAVGISDAPAWRTLGGWIIR